MYASSPLPMAFNKIKMILKIKEDKELMSGPSSDSKLELPTKCRRIIR